MKQIDGAMLTTGEVLDQAHDQAVFGVGVDDEGRNLALAKCLIGFQPTLTADQVVARTICIVPTVTVIGRFRPSSAMFDTISLKIFLFRTRGLITVMRSIGNQSRPFEPLYEFVHATSRSLARAAKPKRASRVSNR